MLIAGARGLGTSIITLCTGTRDPDDMWRAHPENDSRGVGRHAGVDGRGLGGRQQHDVVLAFEPELANVVRDARAARRLLDELRSPHVRIVVDAANLICPGEPQAPVPRRGLRPARRRSRPGACEGRPRRRDVVAAGRGTLDYEHYIELLHAARLHRAAHPPRAGRARGAQRGGVSHRPPEPARRLARHGIIPGGDADDERSAAMTTTTSTTWVYDFSEGSREMRELLGGKGANVAEMTRVLGPERVPAGFTITTEACVAYMHNDRTEPEGLAEQVAEGLARLEERAGKSLGDNTDPLLVSVRSGARESMPGMLDTVLNLGLNDRSVEGLAEATGNERFAWDSYRRFVQMFGNVVRGLSGEVFEDAIKEAKRERDVSEDTDLDAGDLRALTEAFKARYRDEVGDEFPQEPLEQLRLAIRAVFDSWESGGARPAPTGT